MSEVDLHMHSSLSDGRFSPAEIVRKSAEAGLTIMALTDHDNVDGVAPALEEAGNFPHLKLIPGVEISTDTPYGEVHMLGYFIDVTHPELLAVLQKMRDSRQERARKMVTRLADLGLAVDWQRVREIAGGGSIGRPHIARALLEKGHVASIQEAFTGYLAWGGRAYTEWPKINPSEAIELILRAGGLPVLAHPLFIREPEHLLSRLKRSGLTGLEVYYKASTDEDIRWLTRLADRFDLIATGGSDFHGLDDGPETPIGGADVPLEAAVQLMALAGERAPEPTNPHQ